MASADRPNKPVTGELVLDAPPPGRIAVAVGVKVPPEMGGIVRIRVTRYGSRAHDPTLGVESIEYRIAFESNTGDTITIASREPMNVDVVVAMALREWKQQVGRSLQLAGRDTAGPLCNAEWIGSLAANTWKRELERAKARYAQTGGYVQPQFVPVPR